MNQIVTKVLLIGLFLINANCGFKVLDKSKINNFHIKEIQTFGNNRINYKIKNYLLINSSKNNENILSINLRTKKNKNIKEKNIKNEITKYEVLIESNLDFISINDGNNYNIKVSSKGDYLVADNYSTTLSNEKKLVDDLIEDISQQILDEIGLKLNDI
tara:strand:+ start:306 stop:782 length:477 start_codon:yes stop_codon:yes gene_type:complete